MVRQWWMAATPVPLPRIASDESRPFVHRLGQPLPPGNPFGMERHCHPHCRAYDVRHKRSMPRERSRSSGRYGEGGKALVQSAHIIRFAGSLAPGG